MSSRILDKAPPYIATAFFTCVVLLAGAFFISFNWNMYVQNRALEQVVSETDTRNSQTNETIQSMKQQLDTLQPEEDKLDEQLKSTEGFLQ